MQSNDKPSQEIDDTSASAAEDRFEIIVDRVESSGAEIVKDETTPLFVDMGRDEFEIGEKRVVQFNLNKTDFEITRILKNFRSIGHGNKTDFEKLSRPIIEIKLKQKPEMSDQWVVVDLDDMF